jgi:chromosome segregation ATPase
MDWWAQAATGVGAVTVVLGAAWKVADLAARNAQSELLARLAALEGAVNALSGDHDTPKARLRSMAEDLAALEQRVAIISSAQEPLLQVLRELRASLGGGR